MGLTANLFAGMREMARGVSPSIWSLTKADMDISGNPASKKERKRIQCFDFNKVHELHKSK